MTPHTDNVVERPADLTAAWLTAAIGAGDITDFAVERIGTGQMSECYRVQLSYADTAPRSDRPASVVLKVAATDPMSRQTGMTLGLYEREVCFYRDIAPRLQGGSGNRSSGWARQQQNPNRSRWLRQRRRSRRARLRRR